MAGWRCEMPAVNIQSFGNAVPELNQAILRAKDQKIIMDALVLAGHEVQRDAKINVKQVLNTSGMSRGALGRSIMVEPRPEKAEVAVGPSMIYGAIHEFGGIIKPVKGEYLVFKVPTARAFSVSKKTGKVRPGKVTQQAWVKVKQVKMPARPYLHPALETAKGRFGAIWDKVLRKIFGVGLE